jgi:hypothetical protein
MARKKKTAAVAESNLGWFIVDQDGSFRIGDPSEFDSVLDLIDGPEARGTLLGQDRVVWHNPFNGDLNTVATAILGGLKLVDAQLIVQLDDLRALNGEVRTFTGRVVVTSISEVEQDGQIEIVCEPIDCTDLIEAARNL